MGARGVSDKSYRLRPYGFPLSARLATERLPEKGLTVRHVGGK
jgi:hypothetical protein